MMRTKEIIISATLCLSLAFSSCATKQSAYNRLERFHSELSANSADYDISDWRSAAIEFKEIAQKVEKYDYKSAQRKEIRRMEGECVGMMAKGAGSSVINSIIDAGGEIKGFIEGLLDTVK